MTALCVFLAGLYLVPRLVFERVRASVVWGSASLVCRGVCFPCMSHHLALEEQELPKGERG